MNTPNDALVKATRRAKIDSFAPQSPGCVIRDTCTPIDCSGSVRDTEFFDEQVRLPKWAFPLLHKSPPQRLRRGQRVLADEQLEISP